MSLAVSMGLAAVAGPLPDSETVAFQLMQRSRPTTCLLDLDVGERLTLPGVAGLINSR